MPPDATTPRLSVVGVSKHFGGVRALTDVGFAVAPGAVHALLGENGAGKSTLVKIVTGVQPPDSGQILLDGQPARFATPVAARAAGVVAVYQDPKLFPHLDVAENVFVGMYPQTRLGLVARRRMYARAQSLLDTLDAHLDARQPVLGLSIGEAQYIEFARAMAAGEPRLLFLDEPTAALTPAETERLFRLVTRMKDRGAAIVFISHRLEDLRGFVDTVTVLRDGRHVLTRPAATLSESEIVSSMVGRAVDQLYATPPSSPVAREERLRVEGLTAPGVFNDVSFSVAGGEILGVAGLVGAGRSEIAQAIMGLLREPTSGVVTVAGVKVPRPSPRRMQELGVVYLPEDRDGVGLVVSQSIETNLTIAALKQISRFGLIRRRPERRLAERLMGELSIKAGGVGDAVATLSGGNRQKVVLGKWLATTPRVLILDEPTHGVDVGAKAQVHRMIAELAAAGLAVVVISSDLPEVLGVSHRILVVREGRIVASVDRAEASESGIMAAATGAGRIAA